MTTAGCPWRGGPYGQRAREIAAMGATAARRAARARRLAAAEAAVPRRGRRVPGSWKDRELAARPALRRAAAGQRVPGGARYRRNAAWHAAWAPQRGFAAASRAELDAVCAGPRLEDLQRWDGVGYEAKVRHAADLEARLLDAAYWAEAQESHLDDPTLCLGFEDGVLSPLVSSGGVEDQVYEEGGPGAPRAGGHSPGRPLATAGGGTDVNDIEHGLDDKDCVLSPLVSSFGRGGVVRGAPFSLAPGSFRRGAEGEVSKATLEDRREEGERLSSSAKYVEEIEEQRLLWARGRPGQAAQPFVRRLARVAASIARDRCPLELRLGSVAENDEGEVHGFGFAVSATDLAMVMDEESDSEAEDHVVLDRHGRPISRDAAWEEYLSMESRGSRLPPLFRARFLELACFLGIEDE